MWSEVFATAATSPLSASSVSPRPAFGDVANVHSGVSESEDTNPDARSLCAQPVANRAVNDLASLDRGSCVVATFAKEPVNFCTENATATTPTHVADLFDSLGASAAPSQVLGSIALPASRPRARTRTICRIPGSTAFSVKNSTGQTDPKFDDVFRSFDLS